MHDGRLLIGESPRRFTLTRRHKLRKPSVRHFVSIEIKTVEIDAMDRLFVVIALDAAHRELPSRHEHHRRPVLARQRGWQRRDGAAFRGRIAVRRCARLLGRLCGSGFRLACRELRMSCGRIVRDSEALAHSRPYEPDYHERTQSSHPHAPVPSLQHTTDDICLGTWLAYQSTENEGDKSRVKKRECYPESDKRRGRTPK